MKSPDYKKSKTGPSPKKLSFQSDDWYGSGWHAGWGRWNSWRDDWSYGSGSNWDGWDWSSHNVGDVLSKLDSVMEPVAEEPQEHHAAPTQEGSEKRTAPTQDGSEKPTAPTQGRSEKPTAPTQGGSEKPTARDGAPKEEAVSDKWKCDKYGKPLAPAALYMRFYRSLRRSFFAMYVNCFATYIFDCI